MKFKHKSSHVMMFFHTFWWNVDGKTGVSDCQQAPPSYPFAVLSKDGGLAWNRLLDQELRTM